jgi:hypothetical protein
LIKSSNKCQRPSRNRFLKVTPDATPSCTYTIPIDHYHKPLQTLNIATVPDGMTFVPVLKSITEPVGTVTDTGAVGWGTALPTGRSRVRFPIASSAFFLHINLPAALWPWGRLTPRNRNEYQEYFLGGKGGRCVGQTTLPPSCADCLEIWEPHLLNPKGLSRPVMELLYLHSHIRQ